MYIRANAALHRHLVLALILCIAPSISSGADTWTNLGTITAIYSHNGSHIVETTITDGPCGSAGKFWWPTLDTDAKDMFAMALSAFVAGKRIRVVHDPATLNCSNGANLATYMGMMD